MHESRKQENSHLEENSSNPLVMLLCMQKHAGSISRHAPADRRDSNVRMRAIGLAFLSVRY
jgi:hypothetical protein